VKSSPVSRLKGIGTILAEERFTVHSKMGILLMVISSFVLSADLLYKWIFGIGPSNRASCYLYRSFPQWVFWIYEYFVEVSLVLVLGVFLAQVLLRLSSRGFRVTPGNPLTAFIAGSVLPVCSCGAIPFLDAFRNRTSVLTTYTFLVAAPLLNPYIIMISFTMLGPLYAILRIAASFALSLAIGSVMQMASGGMAFHQLTTGRKCGKDKNCPGSSESIFGDTFRTFVKLIPYVVIAGILSLALEWAGPVGVLKHLNGNNELMGVLLAVLVGIPLYLCNGADVMILKPLLENGTIGMPAALAFSLASTSVCMTSLSMLWRYIGAKRCMVFATSVTACIILLSMAVFTAEGFFRVFPAW
jgi:uncharacterized membrane protein YraQ (UPF0718 family)